MEETRIKLTDEEGHFITLNSVHGHRVTEKLATILALILEKSGHETGVSVETFSKNMQE